VISAVSSVLFMSLRLSFALRRKRYYVLRHKVNGDLRDFREAPLRIGTANVHEPPSLANAISTTHAHELAGRDPPNRTSHAPRQALGKRARFLRTSGSRHRA